MRKLPTKIKNTLAHFSRTWTSVSWWSAALCPACTNRDCLFVLQSHPSYRQPSACKPPWRQGWRKAKTAIFVKFIEILEVSLVDSWQESQGFPQKFLSKVLWCRRNTLNKLDINVWNYAGKKTYFKIWRRYQFDQQEETWDDTTTNQERLLGKYAQNPFIW